jgi:hypothetical protein
MMLGVMLILCNGQCPQLFRVYYFRALCAATDGTSAKKPRFLLVVSPLTTRLTHWVVYIIICHVTFAHDRSEYHVYGCNGRKKKSIMSLKFWNLLVTRQSRVKKFRRSVIRPKMVKLTVPSESAPQELSKGFDNF